jgi:thioredoxin 2
MAEVLQIPCPYCDTLNRIPRAKLADGAKCGECHRPLFEARPRELDAARFLRQVEKSDLPLLVDFWAPWCGSCHAMAPECERAAKRLVPDICPVKLNIDAAPEVARRFSIQSIPTMALVLHGRVCARTAGAMSASAIERWALSAAERCLVDLR